MATEPKIYSKNYVNSDDVFTSTSALTAISNLYDRDISSQWVSSGAASDATDVTITITFYEGTVAINRTIDSFLLINHNLKAFDLYYWNGSAYVLWQAFTGLSSSTTFQSLSSQTVSGVKLVLHTTQVAAQEKAIGELTLMQLLLDIGQDFSSYEVAFRQKVKELDLGDGSKHRAVIRWASNRIEKYECVVAWTLLPEATRASLMVVKQLGYPFLWYPESVSKPDEIWYVHWIDPRKYRYHDFVKSAGWDVEINLSEV